MYECVNPSHPDKVADRIAGAIVDLAYAHVSNPKIAVEVLLGHGHATIIVESSFRLSKVLIKEVVWRIADISKIKYIWVPQDIHLAQNQAGQFKCGDNGIFKGVPLSDEEKQLSAIAKSIYKEYPFDGKYILDERYEEKLDKRTSRLIICQSNARTIDLKNDWPFAEVNPLGEWTGGSDVDSGATNRKLGSDMARSVTGGGLHGKDLSKADVSVNIYAFLKAQKLKKPIELCCAIGDEYIDGKPYGQIVSLTKTYIKECGGFESFAKWGLVGGPEPSKFFDLIN